MITIRKGNHPRIINHKSEFINPYCSSPSVAASLSALLLFGFTLTKVRLPRMLESTMPGRKLMRAFLMRDSSHSSSVMAPLLEMPIWRVPISPRRTISPLWRASVITSSRATSTAKTSLLCTVQVCWMRSDISRRLMSPLACTWP